MLSSRRLSTVMIFFNSYSLMIHMNGFISTMLNDACQMAVAMVTLINMVRLSTICDKNIQIHKCIRRRLLTQAVWSVLNPHLH